MVEQIKCSSNQILCYLFTFLYFLPLAHFVYIFYINTSNYIIHSSSSIVNKKRKAAFKQIKTEMILNWVTIGMKFLFITVILITELLQTIIWLLFHDFLLLDMFFLCNLLSLMTWVLHYPFLIYDSYTYGETTLKTRLNYLVRNYYYNILLISYA